MFVFIYNYAAICRQCREHLSNLAANEAVSEPAESPEATGGQTEEEELKELEASDQSTQEEVMYASMINRRHIIFYVS